MTKPIRLLISLAFLCFALGPAMGQATNQIATISPDSATQGTSGVLVTFTLDTDVPPAPPAGVVPDSVVIGGTAGTSIAHSSQYTVTAVFTIGDSVGAKDITIAFTTPNGQLIFSKPAGFTVLAGPDTPPSITAQPQPRTVAPGASAMFSVTAYGTEPLSYRWQKDRADIDGATESTHTISSVTASDAGSYRCVVTNDFGSVISDEATLTVSYESAVSEGYNLFASLESTTAYLMDNDGNFVHSWATGYRPGLSMYLLENGELLATGNVNNTTFNAGGAGGHVQTLDWDGNVTWQYTYSSSEHVQHHDVEMLPNGNVLLIAWQYKAQAEAVAAGRNPTLLSDGALWPDSIIEVQPTGAGSGTIVWEWHIWDHLVQDYDATKDNYGVVANHPELIDLNYAMNGQADWTHINSVDYDTDLDQILLSVHNFSEIWIIDHSTTTAEAAGHTGGNSGEGGDLLYRWGNPQAYGAGTAADQQFFSQHDAEWIENDMPGQGHILIFNNGAGRPGGNYSSVDEIVTPVNPDGSYTLVTGSNYGPDQPVWTYAADTPTDFFALNISGAQRLPNGNTLVCDGPSAHFFEVTASGEIVWDYTSTGNVFRVERYAPDYPGFDGTPLDDSSIVGTTYPIVDTSQSKCYDNSVEISAPALGGVFYGQDAQLSGNQPSYTISGDGLTVHDNVTGLTWTRSPDLNGDGSIDYDDKLSFAEAQTYADTTLNPENYGGYNDWRLPTMKQLYSLMDFRGTDPDPTATVTSNLTPFIDTDYFAFAYGDLDAGERIIDAQFWSSNAYVGTVFGNQSATFGLNLADGRIKGYPTSGPMPKVNYVYFVRGNSDYGINDFTDNGDGTVSDHATGLMWSKGDSGDGVNTGPRSGINWENALAWVQQKNAENYLGYSDWRLPNAKEMQSILDYSRAPATGSAAIDPVFNITQITNEDSQPDYPWFWTSTTHVHYGGGGASAAYICFGRALGYMNGSWLDVHGAGAQRGDTKAGDFTGYTYVPDGYYFAQAPQGDATRIYNYVRLVRDIGTVFVSTATEAKMLADGKAVSISAVVATTDQSDLDECIYVEDAGRAGGIRVVTVDAIAGLIRGSTVNVLGTMATTADGERFIDNATVTVYGWQTELSPVGIGSRGIGGGSLGQQCGVSGGSGLNNVGLLIRTWGRVTDVGFGYVDIDDGGVPIRVDTSSLSRSYGIDDYLGVTGISSLFESAIDHFSIVLPRDDSDVTLIE